MKIAYFAPIPYYGLKQRPQHLAELLSEEHEVCYIEPTISLMKYVLKGGDKPKRIKFNVNPNLSVLRLNGLFTLHRSLEALDVFTINATSERHQLREIMKWCDVIWVGYCGWYNVISSEQNKKIIYDKMDEDALITQNTLLCKHIKHVEPKLIKAADAVFVTAQIFYDTISSYKPETYLIPNAVSENILSLDQKETNSNKRVFGYVGMISHWFDFDVIERILDADEKNYVVLAGPNEQPEYKHERLTYLGTVPKEELPRLVSTFDVCLYPFRKNYFLDTINPVKIYEYLAFNKVTIAVRSCETDKLGNHLYLYNDLSDLDKLLNENLEKPFSDDEIRKDFIRENCWEKRVESILYVLGEL